MAFQNLGKRVAVSLIGAPIVLLCVWAGGWFYVALLSIIACAASYEFLGLLKAKNVNSSKWITLGFVPLFYAIIFLRLTEFLLPFVAAFVVLVILIELLRNQGSAIFNIAGAFVTVLYIGFLYGFLLDLRALPETHQLGSQVGASLVFLVLVATWICDSAAYFVGSRLGKHKLAPRISPNKTIEGALGGIAGGMVAAIACQQLLETSLTVPQAAIVGVIIGVFGQLSDLVESQFKRDAGVKDSSGLLPGHGGILDRFDSELLSVPAIYMYLIYFVY